MHSDLMRLIRECLHCDREFQEMVRLEGSNSDDLNDIITLQIRKIPNISTSLTLTVIESQE